jgi:hypothetical protein
MISTYLLAHLLKNKQNNLYLRMLETFYFEIGVKIV